MKRLWMLKRRDDSSGVQGGDESFEEEYRASRTGNALFTAMILFLFFGSIFIGMGKELNADDFEKTPDQSLSAESIMPVSETLLQNAPADLSGPADAADAETDTEAPVSVMQVSGYTSPYYVLAISDGQQDRVYELSEKYDVPADLIFGIISADAMTHEKNGRSSEHDPVLYLNPESAMWYGNQLGFSGELDFDQNLECGVLMISEYYHKYGDILKIAMCYELGEQEASVRWSRGEQETDYSRLVARETLTLTVRST